LLSNSLHNYAYCDFFTEGNVGFGMDFLYAYIYVVTEREVNIWDNITVNNTVNIFHNV